MSTPSPSRPSSSKNKKSESNILFYSGIAVLLLVAGLFLLWSFEHGQTQPSSQEQGQTDNSNSQSSSTQSQPIQPSRIPEPRVGIVPSAQDLLNAMTPDAEAHGLSLSSVQVVQCTPIVNAFTATQVGEARCQIQIEIAKTGGKPKQLSMPIHVLQNPDKSWKVIQ